jgi:hypothetical protein
VSRRSDYLSAALWAVFGVIVVVASWRIERLENLSINPWSAPGLTPGVTGVLMILLAIALAWQVRRQAPVATEDGETSPPAEACGNPSGGWRSTLLAGAMCVLFAGVSLGHGLPFLAEGAAFIFLFTTVFSWSQWRAQGRIARGLSLTLVIALAASALISWLFESVFLVRLP